MGSLIYNRQMWGGWEYMSGSDVMKLDREKDQLLLEYIARNGSGMHQKAALRKLGISEPPQVSGDSVSDDLFDEEYLIFREQIVQTDNPQVLEAAVWEAGGIAARFAFCRMTGYHYTAPACDAYSHRTFSCGCSDEMTEDMIRDFCKRMVEQHGPFAEEAGECLSRL